MNTEVIINIMIPLMGAIFVYLILPLFKEKTTQAQRANLYFYIKLAVQAAEQIFDYKHAGKDKKQYVIDQVMDAGLPISEQDLNLMIEAAVLELNKTKELIGE